MGAVQAQTANLHERLNVALSPSEKRFNQHGTDMEVRQLMGLYANPSYYEWTHTEDSLLKRTVYRSSVYTGYANGEVKGDFLPYEGNAFYDYRMGANGEYAIRKVGTLFGQVQYARGKHRNVGWNAMRYPELYLPYISTDSIGGDYTYEDYLIKGGYAFTLGQWKLGVNGEFHGEQAWRKTDPRALNKTTWLKFGLGASKMFNGHLLMAQADICRNKQHLELRYWRPGEQDRFFVCYGFGLYDIRQSKVAFGYSRMYYISEGGVRFTYQSPLDRKLNVYASLGYEYDYMKTEETNICDLYYSKTHSLLPSVKVDFKPADQWVFSLWMEGNMDMRKGFENIFERYQSDVANNIYDYRLIDTQQQYDFTRMDMLAQLRARYQFTPQQSISLLGGVSALSREEKYKMANYKVKNASMFPHGRMDYQLRVKQSELQLAVLYGKKVNGDNSYNVRMNNTEVEHLDFQHAFAPYAYYNSTYTALDVSAQYVYHFKKCALGVSAKLMYRNGERDREASFDGKIGYPSTAPMVTTIPDKHDELWGNTSVFFMF